MSTTPRAFPGSSGYAPPKDIVAASQPRLSTASMSGVATSRAGIMANPPPQARQTNTHRAVTRAEFICGHSGVNRSRATTKIGRAHV